MPWQLLSDNDIVLNESEIKFNTGLDEWEWNDDDGVLPEDCGGPKAHIDGDNNLTWSCPDKGTCSGSCSPHKFNIISPTNYQIRCNCSG